MVQPLMLDLTARMRFLICMAIALSAAGADSAVWGQQASTRRVSGATLAPVIDAQEYRQMQSAGISQPQPAAQSMAAGPQPVQVREVLSRNGAPVQFPYPQMLEDASSAESVPGRQELQELPQGFVPWWEPQVNSRLRESAEAHPIDLDALIVSALAFSPRVRTVSEDVLIQETAIVEAQAAFDVHAFMDSKFFRKSEPVGNVLETGDPETGSPNRLREGDWGYSAGLRKRTPLGGSWEFSQRIGMRESNSRFFTPKQQGNARLSLSFNQPLLNGFGKAYNTALILLADIDTSVAMDQTSAALQTQLIHIAEAYWELYLHRSVLLQKNRHLQRAQIILEQLTQRREVDALESQIVRARAAVAARQAELIRTLDKYSQYRSQDPGIDEFSRAVVTALCGIDPLGRSVKSAGGGQPARCDGHCFTISTGG